LKFTILTLVTRQIPNALLVRIVLCSETGQHIETSGTYNVNDSVPSSCDNCVFVQRNVQCLEITCSDTQSAGNQHASSALSASEVVQSACTNNSTNTQTRFSDGTTQKTRKCTTSGIRGVLSGQSSTCQGLLWNNNNNNLSTSNDLSK